MLVLYDLQEEIKDMSVGDFPENNPYLAPCGDDLPTLTVVEALGEKSIMVSNRVSGWDGVYFNVPALKKFWPGDRITVTGRIAHNVPKGSWGMILVRYTDKIDVGMAQHLIPHPDELFSMTYLIDAADLEYPFRIQCAHWGEEIPNMDFFIDSILVTRSTANMDTTIDSRKTIYSLAEDKSLQKLADGEPTQYLGWSYPQRSGEPNYTIFKHNGRNGIHVTHRVNDWDAIDIPIPALELKPNNCYEIKVTGRVDGTAPEGTLIMLQTLPGYIWRDPQGMSDNQEFTLTHMLTAMEIQDAQQVRITTNSVGADISFFIYDIDITVKPLMQ